MSLARSEGCKIRLQALLKLTNEHLISHFNHVQKTKCIKLILQLHIYYTDMREVLMFSSNTCELILPAGEKIQNMQHIREKVLLMPKY